MGDAEKPLTVPQLIEQLEHSNPVVIAQVFSNDAQITLRDRLLLRAWLRPRSTTEPLHWVLDLSPILSPGRTLSLFQLPCITLARCWSQIVTDSSLDVRIAKKQVGPDVEAAIGDASCGRWVLGSRRG